MIDFLIFIFVLVLVVILVPRIMRGVKGCTGSCDQGRKPCDCGRSDNGIQ